MFGDILHGGLLFLFGCFLTIQKDYLIKSSLKSFLPYRYLLLMMGFFATFCGFCYNDMASIPVERFESCIVISEDNVASYKPDCVYPFGIDPYWYLCSNSLTFINSLKMKLSVIFGVAQMCLGIFIKALNAMYFRKKLDLYFEFVPQLTLMVCLFGWMDFLIITKWLTIWEGHSNTAPGVVSIMISMFLNFGEIGEGTDSLVGSVSMQQWISNLLLVV